jgi:TrmH family RNA methyltransferase
MDIRPCYNRDVDDASPVRIVLVRPRNPLNIGAAARAMLNFGFDDLVVVSPHPPVWEESRSAAGAQAVLRKARVAADIRSAVQDRTLVIGTSSLSRRQVSQKVFDLPELNSVFAGYPEVRLAVLFGSEKTGLTNRDISHCQTIAHIPTSARCPSMNLGQAVAICCYEIQRVMGNASRSFPSTPNDPGAVAEPLASQGDLERVAAGLSDLAGGVVQTDELARRERVRQTLLRWPMTVQDASVFLGLIRDIQWKMRGGRAAETPRKFSL